MKVNSVDSDPAALKKEETWSERNEVTDDKLKTIFGSKNRLSLFKRSSTKGSQPESGTSGKPASGAPQISETRDPESSSSETQTAGQTKTSSRSRSATCSLL